MSDNKERVYSEQDLCEYTILQQIEKLQKDIDNLKAQVTGDTLTKEEASATYETKANHIHDVSELTKVDSATIKQVDSLTAVTPTDVGIKDNKLGLLHDTKWLTNQGAINLSGFEYDSATNTLKASGSGSEDSLIVKATDLFTVDEINKLITELAKTPENEEINVYTKDKSVTVAGFSSNIKRIIVDLSELTSEDADFMTFTIGLNSSIFDEIDASFSWFTGTGEEPCMNIFTLSIAHDSETNAYYLYRFSIWHSGTNFSSGGVTAKTISFFGNHSILVPATSTDTNIDLYTHNIVISQSSNYDTVTSSAYGCFLTITSSKNLVVDSITDLNTLLGTTKRYIQCTGTTDDGNANPIKAIDWQGNFTDSAFILANSEDDTAVSCINYTYIKDVVTTA